MEAESGKTLQRRGSEAHGTGAHGAGTSGSVTNGANGNGSGPHTNGSAHHNGSTPAKRRAQKLRRRRITYGIIVAVILAGAIAWWRTHSNTAPDWKKDLQTAQAFRTTLIETVSAQGAIQAETGAEVKIGSQVTGVIKHLYADVGGHVNAGQLIAQLDLPDTQAQLQQAEASLSQAITKLQQQEAGVGMQSTQSTDAVKTALDALRSAQAREVSAAAAAAQQPRQTRSDISKAEAALGAARTAEQQAVQTRNLQVSVAEAAVKQAQAAVVNDQTSLNREEALFKQGFVAASDVDTAQAAATTAEAQLQSARQNLALTQRKTQDDISTAAQQVVQAQAGLAAAQSETYQNAVKQAGVNDARAAVRQSQDALNSAEAGMQQNVLKRQDVQQAAEAVQQAEDQVKYWQAQVAKTYIRSPISGTVLQLASQQGETLAAGLSAPTLIIVANLNRLQVDAFVDETDIGKVHLGQSATITVDAYPDYKFSGRVFKIASGSTLQQGVVTYDVSIAIKQDAAHPLKPDMTTSVTVDVGEHPDVVVVPNEAIRAEQSGSQVYVYNKGMAEPQDQPVQTGATDGTYTEIKSGLQDGDTVVLAGWPPPEGPGSMRMTPFGMRPGRPQAKKPGRKGG